MENFVGDKDIVRYCSSGDECRLVFRDDGREERLESLCEDLGDDFVVDVA